MSPESNSHDSLVSCPIVCGDYMRATGFFFSTARETYLVTARHNVLPTSGEELYSGDLPISFETTDFLPTIDIYLRTDGGFDTKRVDVRGQSGVKHSPNIDLLAVPLDDDPAEYGYRVLTEDDVTSPSKASSSLNLVGFNGECFPDADHESSRELYQTAIGTPRTLPLVNELGGKRDLSRGGLFAQAIDDEFVGANEDYNGFSGAPILEEGLVGVHSNNVIPPQRAVQQLSDDDFVICIYTRAEVLPLMLE